MATANMGLVLPIPGVTMGIGIAPPGQSWLELLNEAFTLVDQHTHASGQGAPLGASSLTIDADLPFNGYNATTLRSSRFTSQASPIGLSTDLTCLYVAGGELYYNDAIGNRIQITASGALAGGGGGSSGGGSIVGLVSPASATYGSAKFTWKSAATQYAAMENGPITIHDQVGTGYTTRVLASPTLAAGIDVYLPSSVPGSTKILTMDSSGKIEPAYSVDGSTLAVAGGTIGIAANGVGTTQLNSGAVTTIKIADANVTRAKLAAVGQQASSSSTSFSTQSLTYVDVTSLSLTITTTGRPVVIMTQGDGNANGSLFDIMSDAGGDRMGYYQLMRGSTVLQVITILAPASKTITGPGFHFVDTPAAGTYTYKVQGKVSNAAAYLQVINTVLVAYEL